MANSFFKRLAKESEGQELIEKAVDIAEQQQTDSSEADLNAIDFEKEIEQIKGKQEQEQEDTDENLLDDGEDSGEGEEGESSEESDESEDDEAEPAEDDGAAPEVSEQIQEEKMAAQESIIHTALSKLSLAIETVEQGNENGYISPLAKKLASAKLDEVAQIVGIEPEVTLSAESVGDKTWYAKVYDMIKKIIAKIKKWIDDGLRYIVGNIREFKAARGVYMRNMTGYKVRLETLKKMGSGGQDWPAVTITMGLIAIKDRTEFEAIHKSRDAYATFITNVLTGIGQVPKILQTVGERLSDSTITTDIFMQTALSSVRFDDIAMPSGNASMFTRGVEDVKVGVHDTGDKMKYFNVDDILGRYRFAWVYPEPTIQADPAVGIRQLSQTRFESVKKEGESSKIEIEASPENGLSLISDLENLDSRADRIASIMKTVTSVQSVFAKSLEKLSANMESNPSLTQEDLNDSLRMVTLLVSAVESMYIQPLRVFNRIDAELMRENEKAVVEVVTALDGFKK